MKNLVVLVLITLSLVISSCSNLIYFTEDVRDNLDYNKLNVEKVQFYNSDKIVLKRNLSKEETQIAKGTIRFENGEYYEEVIIPKKTKGVAIRKGTEFLRVAFETGDNRSLRFDLNEDSKYQISADNWNDNYGCIVYDTTTYFIIPSSSSTVLMVNKEFVSNYEKQRRVLKGRSVSR